jgi:hypothetical protein
MAHLEGAFFLACNMYFISPSFFFPETWVWVLNLVVQWHWQAN